MGQTAHGHWDFVGAGAPSGTEAAIDTNSTMTRVFRTPGAPVNGVPGTGTYAGKAKKYDLLIRTDTNVRYMNTGTLASVTWTAVPNTP